MLSLGSFFKIFPWNCRFYPGKTIVLLELQLSTLVLLPVIIWVCSCSSDVFFFRFFLITSKVPQIIIETDSE